MHLNAVTSEDCALCDGPCRHAFHLFPIPERYPFMSPEDIAKTQPPPEPDEAEQEPKGGKRMRRPREDRMRRPEEDRSA